MFTCAVACSVNLLYGHDLIRYIIAGTYYVALVTVCIVKRKEIGAMFKKKKPLPEQQASA